MKDVCYLFGSQNRITQCERERGGESQTENNNKRALPFFSSVSKTPQRTELGVAEVRSKKPPQGLPWEFGSPTLWAIPAEFPATRKGS